MDEEAKALVKRLLEEGRRYDDVRREVISHGHSTDNFESEYHNIQTEMGIEEPPPTKLTPDTLNQVMNDDAKEYATKATSIDRMQWTQNLFRIFAGVLVLVVAFIMLSGYGRTLIDKWFGPDADVSETGLSASDIVLQSKMKSFQQSAKIYQSKITDYTGVCESIGLDKNLYTCAESAEAYLITSPLSNGQLFCVDSTGFSGAVSKVTRGALSCN